MGKIGTFVVGVIVGGVIAAATFWLAMPNMMLHVSTSLMPFEQTVTTIESNAVAAGWQVPKIYNLQESLLKAGKGDIKQLKVVSLCQPEHAYNILSDDANKAVSAMMPCRIGVFEMQDGSVRIAQVNMGMMAKMFGGKIQEVMGEVSKEEAEILGNIIAY